MGCFGSKEKEDPNKKTTEKAYSWDNRKNIDPKDFTIDGLNDGLVIRKPGSIDGQQFIIQNCSNSRIYLFDHIAAITVDDCSNCQIIIGPVKSSIFIRDCENCKFIVACQQFRTRDCSKLDVLLLCATQPIIEASAKLKFGCYQFYYDGIEEQFKKSQLGLFCNNWSNIHDFTPVSDKANWSLIDEDCDVIEMFPGLQNKEDNEQEPELASLKISSKVEDSVVMLTHGSRKRKFSDTCFIVVFHCDTVKQIAKSIVSKLSGRCVLVRLREATLTLDDAKRILPDHDLTLFKNAIKKGKAIGLELNGDDCCNSCNDVIATFPQNEREMVYASPSSDMGVAEVERFFDFCDIQLTI